MKAGVLLAAAAMLLSACGQDQHAWTDSHAGPLVVDTSSATPPHVTEADVVVEYEKRLSDTETLRGLRVPFDSGNPFLAGILDVRCLLYVNDAYRTTQIICPESSGRHPRDVIVETGTEEPYN